LRKNTEQQTLDFCFRRKNHVTLSTFIYEGNEPTSTKYIQDI